MARTFTVRRGMQSDLSQIVQLTIDLAVETENGLILDEATLNVGISRGLPKRTDTVSNDATPMYWVAENIDDGRLIGFLAVSPEWSDWWATWYWWVISVSVDRKFRRLGVGTLLFELMQKDADQALVQTVNLRVEKDNGDATQFYQRIGFVVDDSHRVMSRGKRPNGEVITASSSTPTKCPFATMGGPNPHTSKTNVDAATVAKGECPWPFILLHDPKRGVQNPWTWLAVGVVAISIFKINK